MLKGLLGDFIILMVSKLCASNIETKITNSTLGAVKPTDPYFKPELQDRKKTIW